MNKNEIDVFKKKLKAYFTANLFSKGDLYGPAYSTLTGGDLEGYKLKMFICVKGESCLKN